MRTMVLITAAAAALIACNPEADVDNPPVATDENRAERSIESPAAGANSFTEAQARSRLIERGYSEPVSMSMTDAGAWRAVTRDAGGDAVTVLVDYQGNITVESRTGTTTPGSSSSGSSSTGSSSSGTGAGNSGSTTSPSNSSGSSGSSGSTTTPGGR